MRSESEIRTMIDSLMSAREAYNAIGDRAAEEACCNQIDALLWTIGASEESAVLSTPVARILGTYLSEDTISFLHELSYEEHRYITREDAAETIDWWKRENIVDGAIVRELTPDILTWYNNYVIMSEE